MENDKNKNQNEKEEQPSPSPVVGKSNRLKDLLSNKPARVGLIAVIAMPLILFLGWWGWSSSSLSKLGVDAAVVEGTVQYRLSAGSSWEKLSEGASLGEGAEVRTLEASRAVLNIDDGSAVRLNNESSVLLKKLTSKHIVIENTGGDVYTRVVKSEKRVFQVVSGTATYQSEGTAYRTLNTEEKDGVEVYHSKVSILGVREDGTLIVEEGEKYYLINKDAPDEEGKVSEITLEELAGDEFIKWNSEQDQKDFKDELGVLSDLKGPALEVSSPANGLVTDDESVDVKGTTEKGAKVTVNGKEVDNNEGSFATSVKLNEGKNTIMIVAMDGAGNKTTKSLTVTRGEEESDESTLPLKLTGVKTEDGIKLTWSLNGISASKGFKLVASKESYPTYPGDSAVFMESSKRSYIWELVDGKTYHFRICVYTGEGCGTYSNDITVTAPNAPAPYGDLDLFHTGGANFEWDLDGSAPYGFKLVWSVGDYPEYPGSSYKFFEKTAVSGSVDGVAVSGTYWFRICMYYNGGCVHYSNQVQVTIP